MLRRITPALLLLLLAPVIAEFLLGDFTIRKIGLVLALLPLYGGGALLVREIARRAGRGWPSMLLLAIAYAVLEEAFLTQSLFNPNYAGQRLLDYGAIGWLGTSPNWVFFVLTIHVVWSIATPILIAEGVAADRRSTPWLMKPGTAVVVVLFLLGCASTAAFSLKASPFVASGGQFAAGGVAVVLAVIAAFTVAGGRRDETTVAPRPVVAFLVCLLLAVAFMFSEDRNQAQVPPLASLAIRLAVTMTACGLLLRWGRTRDWGTRHYLAIAAATTLTYTAVGFIAFLHGRTNLGEATNTVDLIGQAVLSGAVFAAIWIGARTASRQPQVGSRWPVADSR